MSERDTPLDGEEFTESPHQLTSSGISSTASRRKVLHLLGAGGVAGVAGCASGGPDGTNSTEDGSGDTATAEETESLQQSATIAMATNVTGDIWDVYGGVSPYKTNVLEPLIWVTDEMKKEPWLATEWEAVDDTTWEFTLRDGVTFHNGDPLRADAVVFSFKEILTEWEWAPAWLRLTPDRITTVDDLTVEFSTTEPLPYFPGSIAHNMVAIQHPDRNREDSEVIGTGPYKVDEITPDQHVTVSAFDEYWNTAPTTAELTFRPIADPNTRALALTGHNVDIAFKPPKAKFDSLTQTDETDVIKKVAPRAGFGEFHVENAPVDDVTFRKGLNYAVSQKGIVDSVMNGIGEPARGPIAKIIYWSAHDSLPQYGPDKDTARELIEQSSYDGETLQLLITNNPQSSQAPVASKQLAQVLQQTASDVGVDIQIQTFEYSTFIDKWDQGNGHLRLFEMGTKSAAADYLIDNLPLSEEVSSRIEEGKQATDPAEKKAAYEEVIQHYMEQAVVIPLYYKQYLVGTYGDIEDVEEGLRPIAQMVRWTGLKHLQM